MDSWNVQSDNNLLEDSVEWKRLKSGPVEGLFWRRPGLWSNARLAWQKDTLSPGDKWQYPCRVPPYSAGNATVLSSKWRQVFSDIAVTQVECLQTILYNCQEETVLCDHRKLWWETIYTWEYACPASFKAVRLYVFSYVLWLSITMARIIKILDKWLAYADSQNC